MPTPPRTDNEAIIRAARKLVEDQGADFSVADLAAAVNIKAPSLYKRFRDKAAILSAVEAQVITDHGNAIREALESATPDPIRAAGNAHRRFAKANPGGYSLMFSRYSSEAPAVQEARTEALKPFLAFLAKANPDGNALNDARMLTAFLHGFVSMEIAGAFHMGGDVDEAFEAGLDRIAGTLS